MTTIIKPICCEDSSAESVINSSAGEYEITPTSACESFGILSIRQRGSCAKDWEETMHETEEWEMLKQWKPWLLKVAWGMCRQFPDRTEEVAQEGWIAIWRVTKTHTPNDGLFKTAALNKMRNAVRDYTSPVRDVRRTDLTDFPEDLISIDLTEIEAAYHYGEISSAINALPQRQREYVVLKYWLGWTEVEMIEHFGYRPKTLGVIARSTLAKELAHLGVE